jgi:hypothetical protein
MSRTRILGAVALVALVGAAVALVVRKKPDKGAAAAASAPAEDVAGSLRVGRHVFQVGKEDALQGSLDIFTDGKLVRHITGTNFSLGDFVEPLEGWTNGSDINGDSVPEVVVMEDSGGAHCCTSWRIFHAGETVEQIYEFSNGHTDFFPFLDARHDGNLALTVYDWTFAYWKTAFASSPAMRLLYVWRNGTYNFSPELTRTPPFSEDDLREKVDGLDWDQSAREANAPPQFWADMLDLIGTGHADQLATYVRMAWPADRPGKSAFLSEFAAQLRKSAYWAQLNELNKGKLEAALTFK